MKPNFRFNLTPSYENESKKYGLKIIQEMKNDEMKTDV